MVNRAHLPRHGAHEESEASPTQGSWSACIPLKEMAIASLFGKSQAPAVDHSLTWYGHSPGRFKELAFHKGCRTLELVSK